MLKCKQKTTSITGMFHSSIMVVHY